MSERWCRAAAAWTLALVTGAGWADELRLMSGDWHPYVDSERITEAELLVSNLLALDGDSVRWRYPGFYFAAEHLRAGTAEAGFPFFKTAERERDFAFSAPVLTVDNVVVYHRRHNDFAAAPPDLGDDYWRDVRVGGVAGYSYAQLDGYDPARAKTYGSEQRALSALLQGDIDLLPIEHSVWRSLVLRRFPNQFYLIAEVPGLGWTQDVHLVMRDDADSRARLAQFDARLAQFRANNPNVDFRYDTSDIVATLERGTAVLEATRLQPLIIGYVERNGELERRVIIPEGTSVIVTDWADAYFEHRSNVSVVSLLQALSRVLIVDGPHVGSEVHVQNTHIRVR